jgi:Flp pilus assembly protein TadB
MNRGETMERRPGMETQQEQQQQKLKKMGKRALWINIIFFAVLFGGMFLVPVSGIYVAALVIVLAFVVSMLYIYLF